jgi:NAD+ synthase
MAAQSTFDSNQALSTIKRFIAGKLLQSGHSGYVVGISGGIDSALAATLAKEAVGSEAVLGLLMPYQSSTPASVTDAIELAEWLGIEYRQIDISPMINAYYQEITEDMRLRAGNKMARERMSLLFDVAHETGKLVLGTGNRTEISLGYTTWFGDAACSINPIGELYKTEVRNLSRELGIPASILEKTPSADLWPGQTDEAEIGVRYEQIDKLLVQLVDNGVSSMETLQGLGFDSTDISRVVSLINRHGFKRRMPDIAPLGRTAIPSQIDLES